MGGVYRRAPMTAGIESAGSESVWPIFALRISDGEMPLGVSWSTLPSPAFETSFLQHHWGMWAGWSPVAWGLSHGRGAGTQRGARSPMRSSHLGVRDTPSLIRPIKLEGTPDSAAAPLRIPIRLEPPTAEHPERSRRPTGRESALGAARRRGPFAATATTHARPDLGGRNRAQTLPHQQTIGVRVGWAAKCCSRGKESRPKCAGQAAAHRCLLGRQRAESFLLWGQKNPANAGGPSPGTSAGAGPAATRISATLALEAAAGAASATTGAPAREAAATP
jgi:hypothetical protein